jgi:hypothetical protein
MGTAPVGSMIISWIAETFGAQASIWLGGAVSLAAAVAALVWQLRHSGEKLSFQIRPIPKLRVVESDKVLAA